MRKNALRLALGAASILAGLAQAQAAQKTVTTKDNTGSGTYSFCAFDAGSFGIAPCHVPINSSGVELFTLATPGAVGLDFGGALLTLGQKAKAGSLPVALPLDPDILNAAATITAADAASTTATGQNSVSVVSGTPTAGSVYSYAVNGQSEADFTITSTFTGTLVFEGSANGGLTWTPRSAHVMGTKYRTSTITAPGIFHINAAGLTNIRVRATALASGTPSVQLNTTSGTGSVYLMNPVELTDNTTGLSASIKAGGTAAPTDPAITVYDAVIAALTGSPSDAAFTGSGNPASLFGLFKGLFNQAPPTSNPGTSIGSTTPVPGFQGVNGGVPLNVIFGTTPTINLGALGGAATAANQNSTAAGTSATNAQGVQGVTGGVPLKSDTVVQGTGADVGGTIATANTAQTFMAANTNRRAWSLQNQSTGDLYVNCSATATADYHSLKIPTGALYESATTHVSTGACSIIGATAGAGFYARQF